MPTNLYLKLDDGLHGQVALAATASGRSVEEELRKRLMEGAGYTYKPPTEMDIASDDRPHLMFDLTRPAR